MAGFCKEAVVIFKHLQDFPCAEDPNRGVVARGNSASRLQGKNAVLSSIF
jgi:hypothetical protein